MTVRVPLYDRLPEIYRIEDAKQDSGEPLARAARRCSSRPSARVHENIESLYHDLFIETCADWAVPYIADLLGTSHLTGDPCDDPRGRRRHDLLSPAQGDARCDRG